MTDAINTLEIGNGVCVNWNLETTRYFDLKKFDGENRDHEKAASIMWGDATFVYKACQPKFSFDLDSWVASGIDGKFPEPNFKDTPNSTGFWVSKTDLKALYTFNNAAVKTQDTTTETIDDVATTIDHWSLTWKSEEACLTDKA